MTSGEGVAGDVLRVRRDDDDPYARGHHHVRRVLELFRRGSRQTPDIGEGPMAKREPEQTLRLGIAVLVFALWLVANSAQVYDPTRQVPLYVNLMFAVVSGWLFGSWAVKRKGGGDDDAS